MGDTSHASYREAPWGAVVKGLAGIIRCRPAYLTWGRVHHPNVASLALGLTCWPGYRLRGTRCPESREEGWPRSPRVGRGYGFSPYRGVWKAHWTASCPPPPQVRHLLQQLKGRVARETIQKLHPGGLLGRQRQPPAPIEVWTELAEKVTGPLEDALTAAFSQVLTIAATEPLSLLHSRPPKPTRARGKLLLSTSDGLEASNPEGPATSKAPTESPAGPSSKEDFPVDFEKIYKYLASFSRSGPGPELSAAESAVVLDLLLSLPEELARLPCTALAEHMTEAYLRLTAPQPSPAQGSPESRTEDGSTGSRGHEVPSQAIPQTPECAGPGESRSAWQAAGVCPLNPFLVPLELLGQVATPAT
ncbi:snRNA-activating protein complex subunit 2 [Echinops telfairi]|uniref:snRNA-activating protein complex subunit 2 n=1 Tax=Echinops telfairi TaxID=9371 RepID=A0AC55D3B8_ECHTE|nr:snRNA-activating protein complex subunit 2 [Echinops telfairi]